MNDDMATSARRFLPLSAEVAAVLGPGPLQHVAETGSTNDDLAQAARQGDASGVVLVADHQTAGKGRLDRAWEDRTGEALLVSVRIPATQGEAASIVRAAGAAARAAVASLCRDTVLAKWPNDLVIKDGPSAGKLAGLLAEFIDGSAPCVVVGIGINVAPMPSQPGSTSVVEAGGPDDRDLVLAALLRELAPRLEDSSLVLNELRTHSATLGTAVRVMLPGGRTLEGDAVALTDTGELEVADAEGVRHIVSTGDVVHVRSR